MVKYNKSNWLLRGLLLALVVVGFSFYNNPKALSSSVTELNKIETSDITIQTPQSMVITAPETVTTANLMSSEAAPAAAEKQTAKPFVSVGYGLKIDAIGINIPLSKTTLDKNQTLIVPANPNTAAWYKSGPVPGAAGTALVTGHLDSAAGPGVFINLRKLAAGDMIDVQRDDGKVATFKVDKLASYAQDMTFPWNQVYSTKGAASLRIITCDGVYNPKTGHYSKNLVVYASLVSIS